ncbi:MgtC/SapB transporter family protein [Pasteurella multocida]|uniref:Protein MgtC n=1 Tax=Pasteurella dagmatis ATCC 43325 TaxID=667128 RepID=C9PP34_9PAST|nr:MgtC/SapB family protein [Pasteurella dagmatis]EEX50664.1 Mg2+ transporter-C family protein [Pasteurella dagmatis ATCC 43325]SNV79268.1 MgtC/SapB transporter family protein [Pasteurella dagmatis]VEI58596.1 MgtC/SapB transporter family protein [Pasteurella multocida]
MKSAVEFFNLFLVSTHFYILAKMAMAMLLGGIIGFERELKRKPVGVKTCVIIAVTTCVLTIVSIQAAEHYAQVSENIRTDPMRLAAQVISGIGFLGAGVILRKSNDAISGLTTAAIIWAAAGIGIASGAGFFFDAIIATMMILVAVRLSPIVQSLVRRKNNIRKTKITIQLNTPNAIGKITDILISNNYRVDSLNVKDLPNTDDVRLNVRCLITDKMMLQNLYLLLKNEPEVVSVDLEG